MKKLLVLLVIAGISLPIVAMSAGTPAKAGKYTGKITSVLPDLNNQPVAMELKANGNDLVGTVTYKDGKEVWTWNEKTLTQQEIDLKTGAATLTYGATNSGGQYKVNCKAGKCDADIDSRNYWTISNDGNKIVYTVYGVGKDKKADPKATPEQRHQFTFTLAQ